MQQAISEILRSNINMVEPYPDTVEPTGAQVNGTAFFPGGSGLYFNSSRIKDILVLGQDFSTVDEYKDMLAGKKLDMSCPTWRNMIKLFDEADLDLNRCFFSNVFMGLRKTQSSVGEFPGYKDKEFVKRNQEFLRYQIDVILPRGIITLGKYAAEMLSQTFPHKLESWSNYKALLKQNCGYIENVKLSHTTCCCVPLEHPSMRVLNVKRRTYHEASGNDAEVLLLKELVKKIS